MARKSLLVTVLLLALTKNRIDCSPSMEIEGSKKKWVNCRTATYENDRLDDFVENCAPENWREFFGRKIVKDAIESFADQIAIEAQTNHIQPPMPFVFEALKRVAPWNVRVVILGQDPTSQVGQATGQAFSVRDPLAVGSALNVLMEVALEGWSVDLLNGDLSRWAKQGVLLLNSALTIGLKKKGKKKIKKVNHSDYWCPFTKFLIEYISYKSPKSVRMLWRKKAQDITLRIDLTTQQCIDENRLKNLNMINFKSHPSLIDKANHYIITGGHPSALAGAGRENSFIGGDYFNCANLYLDEKGRGEIDWGLAEKNKKSPVVNRGLKVCPPFTHIFFKRPRPVY